MSYDQTIYPYDTVVLVTDTIGGEDFQGSGVLISPDEVLTASHVVYNSSLGAATDILVSPAYGASGAPYGTTVGSYAHYNEVQDGDDLITLEQSQYDYAVIHLETPFNDLGTMGLQADFSGGEANITGYPGWADGVQYSSQQVVSVDPNYTLLDGTSLGQGSSGGPVWIEESTGPHVVGLVSSAVNGFGSTGYNVQITDAALDQIEAWVAQDDGSGTGGLGVFDTSTDQIVSPAISPYSGPVAGLQDEFIDITNDNLNITAHTDNWFIHSGSGTDAIAVTGGTNVLDGGTGSNFLSGGSGFDTFFVDDRAATSDIWSTVNDFHGGDAATIWGVTPDTFSLDWVDGQGASGFTGLTLHATATDRPTASLTLTGYSLADLNDGRLSVSYGSTSGGSYMYVHAA